MRALLVAVLLSVAAPVAVQAAESTSLPTNPAATTPLDTNLLANPGFETVVSGVPVPAWTVAGDVRVETFGTRSWPSQVYGTKWHGGKRYLACVRNSGSVTQTVNFDGYTPRPYPVTARFRVDFGGTIYHSIRVSLRMTGDSGQVYKEKFRVLPYSNHYLNAVVTLGVPLGATHITATIDLIKMDGAKNCRVVADSANLYVYRDG
jgi:hypothetical protein